MAHHTAHEIQEGMGETGRFGEVFVGLAILMAVAGIVFWVIGERGHFDESPVGHAAAANDWFILGFILFIEGVGFGVFGFMAVLSGWARHHADFEF